MGICILFFIFAVMKVFKALETCTISWRDPNGRANDFVLYSGDFFFIEENVGWVRKNDKIQNSMGGWDSEYGTFDMLVKIYHNKMIDIDGNREWTWLHNLNLINPLINKNIQIGHWEKLCPDILEDVSIPWNRDEKLNKLLINDN